MEMQPYGVDHYASSEGTYGWYPEGSGDISDRNKHAEALAQLVTVMIQEGGAAYVSAEADSVPQLQGDEYSEEDTIEAVRGGNYKVVRENLKQNGKANSKKPMDVERKKIRRRKRKSK